MFYNQPIKDVLANIKSFLKNCFSIHNPSHYLLYQAVVLILKTRYGQILVDKQSSKTKSLDEAQLQKFANKKIKLENYKSVLLGFLRNAKIPITFCGNDYFNKATKKIRNQFFELEIVKRVWNQIMEQATEEELFQGSSIYEEHIETFKKISAEFLTYRYPLMLPQWWYQKFEPLVQVPKKIFKKTRS